MIVDGERGEPVHKILFYQGKRFNATDVTFYRTEEQDEQQTE